MLGAVLNRHALAAPQAQLSLPEFQLTAETGSCDPNTGWLWTRGPSRPEVAQQAELALKNRGIESAVTAADYGETNSCGDFERFSIDFTVNLIDNSRRQLSPDAESGSAENILATLSQFGEPQLGNVRIDFGSGAVKSYASLPDVQAPLAKTDALSGASLSAEAPLNRKVLLLVYNPVMSNGQDLNNYMGWPRYETSVQGVIDSFQRASNGQLQYTIADTQIVANEWPALTDGFRYTEATYLAVIQNGAPPHDPQMADYDAIMDNPQFDICGKFNRGEIDELWMYGGPYFGFYEARLVGPGAYMFNGPPMMQTHNCNKLLPIMGLNYERGVQEALHAFGHRAEATMTQVYGGWQQNRTAHSWDRFALVQFQSPAYSYSGCGNIHYAPNSTMEYEYDNPATVLTNCEDFRNYPELNDPILAAEPVTCTAWNCHHMDYLLYWFDHLPSYAQCGPDAVANNWWSYFVDPSLALYPALNCPSVPPGPILAGETIRVSVNSAGGQASNASDYPVISADGRFAAFMSLAPNLVWGDTNGLGDIFVRDLQTGLTTRVSVDSLGGQANRQSTNSSISGDGRYVAFASYATNLVPGDTNDGSDIFVHDMQTGTTELISVDPGGGVGGYYSESPSISHNGRYVVFNSFATNLVPGDTNGTQDVFVRDLQPDLTTLVSVDSSGIQANGPSDGPSISGDGRYIAFASSATNLVAGDTNRVADIFVRDLQTGVTTRVSVDSNGVQANVSSSKATISADGRYIAFESFAENLVPGDTNQTYDIFVHDLQTGKTTRASVNSDGLQANRLSTGSSISADGRYVTFYSDATNLVTADTNGRTDVFVRDLQAGTTTLVSADSSGVQSNHVSSSPSISGDGQFIVFRSFATNLAPGDTNETWDIFLHRQEILLPPTVTPTFTPTLTPTSTPTSTSPTPPSTSPNQSLYLSLTSSQIIGGVASADDDILRFDGTNWSLFFDGSDVGVGSSDLFAFSIVDADTILMSFGTNVTVNGIAATPQDILQFEATSLGSTTAGNFSLYFDGSNVGLDSPTNEKIDSLSLLPDGRLLLSMTGNPSVPGLTGGRDEDVLAFTPVSLGEATSGTWSLYFDGSDVGLEETSGEDIDALDIVDGNVYLSTQGDFAVDGLAGADEDVFVCAATSLGEVTACTYSPGLYFDGSAWGLNSNGVDAFNFLASGPIPPTAVPTDTPTPTPTATWTGSTFTFAPLEDAYVNAGSPTTNYGSSTTLRADASPDVHSYLRFNVTGLSGEVAKATLRVFANSASSLGCTANGVSDITWTAQTINYDNAPAVGSPLGSSGPFGANVWVDMDVTAHITGNGTYSLALTTASSTALSLASSEAGANAPRLIVETMP